MLNADKESRSSIISIVMRWGAVWAVALWIGLAVAGCSPPPRTVAVVGSVTHDGMPVEGATVVFLDDRLGDHTAVGVTDEAGHYELSTFFSANDLMGGAIPGGYVVSITKFKRPDTERAMMGMRSAAAQGRDVLKYMREQSADDMWPDGVPEGWPRGYIPSASLPPPEIFDDPRQLERLSLLMRGVPMLPLRYSDPATSGFHAVVDRSREPLVFDFSLTGEIEPIGQSGVPSLADANERTNASDPP